MLSCVFFIFFLDVYIFSLVYHAGFKRLQEFSVYNGSDRDARTRWMRRSFRAGHGSLQSLIQKGTVVL